MSEEAIRFIERDDAAGRCDQLRKVEGREAGARADVEHREARPYPRAFPTRKRLCAPQTVLQAEALQLGVVRTEDVFVFVRQFLHVPQRALGQSDIVDPHRPLAVDHDVELYVVRVLTRL